VYATPLLATDSCSLLTHASRLSMIASQVHPLRPRRLLFLLLPPQLCHCAASEMEIDYTSTNCLISSLRISPPIANIHDYCALRLDPFEASPLLEIWPRLCCRAPSFIETRSHVALTKTIRSIDHRSPILDCVGLR
jgi:hypothetical protein